MGKLHVSILSILLVTVLLVAAGSSAGALQVKAQAPTPSPFDEGDPITTPFDPVLPAPFVADAPLNDQPPATGGTPDMEALQDNQPDILPEFIPAACLQGPGPWEERAPFSAALIGAGVVSDGVFVYVAGGGMEGGGVSNLFMRYDPVGGVWDTLAPLPTAVEEPLVLYAEGKIFLLGGSIGAGALTDLVQIYTIASNTWTTGSPMPGVRNQMSGGYHMGIIYAVGGYNTGGVSPQSQTWGYSIAANSWAIKTPMPAAVAGAGSQMVNGHLFVIGGRDVDHMSLSTVYDYSVATNSWSVKTPLPVSVNYPATAVYLNRIWVFGGGDPFNGRPDTQIYDPQTNTWATGPNLNNGRSFLGGTATRNQIVSVAGWNTSYSNSFEVAVQPALNALIVYSDGSTIPATLQEGLLAQPGIGRVDTFNGSYSTPTLEQLMAYDVVIPFSNNPFADPVSLGNNLADFQDSGGVVVLLAFDWSDGFGITGRWETGGYAPFNKATGMKYASVTLGTVQQPGHALLAGVTTLNVYYHTATTPASGAVQVASWSDGSIALAYKSRAVGINAYLGDFSGQWSGDFAAVIANAAYLLRSGAPACVSLSCKGPTYINGAISDTDLTQTNRLFRDDPASTCAAPATCSITSVTGALHYDLYPFINNHDETQCVSVTLDPGICGPAYALQSAAYLGKYDPANLCGNFLGDVGGSPSAPKTYSFSVGGWQAYQIVVVQTNPDAFCSGYRLTVSPEQCSDHYLYLPFLRR